MGKRWIWISGLVVLVPVFVLTGCCPLVSQGPMLGLAPSAPIISNQQEGVWVNGEGKVTATPDIAVVSLGIEAQSTTVAAAQAQAASAMDKVMTALASGGVAAKDIQTQYFSISRVTRWDDKNQQEITIGYRVSNTVSAKVREIDKAGAIIDAVAVAGGDLTRINDISFTIDDPTIYHQEARDKAMTDAKNKAEQLAALAGIRLGKPTYISESAYTPVPIYRGGAMMEGAAPAPTTPISPGEMEVKLNVQVVYAIVR